MVQLRFQDGSVAIANGDVVEAYHLLGIHQGRGIIVQREDGIPAFVIKGMEWGTELLLRRDPDDLVNIGGHVFASCHHQIDGQLTLSGQ